MSFTYTLIASNTLTTTAASVTFSAIPQTYTDLVVRCSLRTALATGRTGINVTFNGLTTNLYSTTALMGSGSTTDSYRNSNTTSMPELVWANGASFTSDTFANNEIYIPNYTSNFNKPVSSSVAQEQNATSQNTVAGIAALWRNTAAITSITFVDNNGTNFVSGSSFFLYGIKNS